MRTIPSRAAFPVNHDRRGRRRRLFSRPDVLQKLGITSDKVVKRIFVRAFLPFLNMKAGSDIHFPLNGTVFSDKVDHPFEPLFFKQGKHVLQGKHRAAMMGQIKLSEPQNRTTGHKGLHCRAGFPGDAVNVGHFFSDNQRPFHVVDAADGFVVNTTVPWSSYDTPSSAPQEYPSDCPWISAWEARVIPRCFQGSSRWQSFRYV